MHTAQASSPALLAQPEAVLPSWGKGGHGERVLAEAYAETCLCCAPCWVGITQLPRRDGCGIMLWHMQASFAVGGRTCLWPVPAAVMVLDCALWLSLHSNHVPWHAVVGSTRNTHEYLAWSGSTSTLQVWKAERWGLSLQQP